MSDDSELAVIRAGLMIAGTLLTTFCSPSTEPKPIPLDCVFQPAQGLGSIVNSTKFEGSPTVSADQTSLFFTSARNGQQDLFVSNRPVMDAPWNQPVNLGGLVNDPVGDDFSLRLSIDGNTLYFGSNRLAGVGAADLYVTTRESPRDAWSRAMNLGPVLNTAAFEAFPTPSTDGNTLYFDRSTTFDSEDSDIWVTSRRSRTAHGERPNDSECR